MNLQLPNTEKNQFISIAKLLLGLITLVTITVEVFIRKRMGERYLNILVLLIPPIAFFTLNSGAHPMTKEYIGLWLKVFFGLYFVIALAKMLSSRFQKEAQELIHSRYGGEPLLFSNKSETSVKYYREPIAVLVVGGLFMFIGKSVYFDIYGLGAYLCLASGCMVLRGQIAHSLQRKMLLDKQDQIIEHEALHQAISGQKTEAKKHFGFAIPGALPSKKGRQKLQDMYSNLSPSLQKLQDKQSQPDRALEREVNNQKSVGKENGLEQEM